jgi:hypothetical protein
MNGTLQSPFLGQLFKGGQRMKERENKRYWMRWMQHLIPWEMLPIWNSEQVSKLLLELTIFLQVTSI